jgi:hypothetical protein
MNAHDPEKGSQTDQTETDNWLRLVRQHVASLSFGEVVITVHDSRVVQIEKTEKLRLPHKT